MEGLKDVDSFLAEIGENGSASHGATAEGTPEGGENGTLAEEDRKPFKNWCEMCKVPINSPSSWEAHEKGRRHQAGVLLARGRAGGEITPEEQALVDERTRHVFVANLPFGITQQDLRTLFQPYGNIEEVRVFDRYHYAFINYEKIAEAEDAINALAGTVFRGRQLDLQFGEGRATNNLWVGNVADTVTTDDLKALFGEFGDVEHVYIKHATNCSFVSFFEVENATNAMRALQGYVLHGWPLKIGYGKMRYFDGQQPPPPKGRERRRESSPGRARRRSMSPDRSRYDRGGEKRGYDGILDDRDIKRARAASPSSDVSASFAAADLKARMLQQQQQQPQAFNVAPTPPGAAPPNAAQLLPLLLQKQLGARGAPDLLLLQQALLGASAQAIPQPQPPPQVSAQSQLQPSLSNAQAAAAGLIAGFPPSSPITPPGSPMRA